MSTSSDRLFSQKIRTLFSRFDIDKNGFIEMEDFQQWAIKLSKIGGFSQDRTNELIKSILLVWEVFFQPADINNDGSVEIPELVIHMKNVVSDANKKKSIEALLSLIFDAVDTNLDESISSQEFHFYFLSIGVNDEKFTNELFNAIDKNRNELLSKNEFLQFGFEFFVGSNPHHPSKYFFGPLVK